MLKKSWLCLILRTYAQILCLFLNIFIRKVEHIAATFKHLIKSIDIG